MTRATGISLAMMLIAFCTFGCAASHHQPQPSMTLIDRSEINAALARVICITDQSEIGPALQIGNREECRIPANSPLDEAIDSAINRSYILIVNVPPAFEFRPAGLPAAKAESDPRERNRLAAEALLSYDGFMNAVMPYVYDELEKRSLSCHDCPVIAPPPTLTVTYEEIFPYVAAYVVIVPDGFKICSGWEVAEKIPNADPALVRAGFIAAHRSLARVHASRIALTYMNTHRVMLIPGEALAELNAQVLGALAKAPEIKPSVCQALEQYSHHLGVMITNCT